MISGASLDLIIPTYFSAFVHTLLYVIPTTIAELKISAALFSELDKDNFYMFENSFLK
jgi:hypothetical protein